MRVVITGASSGIGEALARYYARDGTMLGLIARRTVDARALSRKAVSYAVDVTDDQALAAVAQDFVRRFGRRTSSSRTPVGVGTAGSEMARRCQTAQTARRQRHRTRGHLCRLRAGDD